MNEWAIWTCMPLIRRHFNSSRYWCFPSTTARKCRVTVSVLSEVFKQFGPPQWCLSSSAHLIQHDLHRACVWIWALGPRYWIHSAYINGICNKIIIYIDFVLHLTLYKWLYVMISWLYVMSVVIIIYIYDYMKDLWLYYSSADVASNVEDLFETRSLSVL